MARRNKRVAAIDIGTNSIHMIIAEALVRGGYRIIDKEKEMVQLGRGSLGGEPLTSDAIERGVGVLARMTEIAKRWEVDDLIAVATSAVREAPNRRAFLNAVKEASGLKVRVISGEEEADYIYRAVRAAVDLHGGTVCCIDIGGGSVELIVGTEREVFFTASEPAGSLRMTQTFFDKASAVDDCRKYVRKKTRKAVDRARSLGFDLCVGTSGTIMTLAELAEAPSKGDDPVAAGLRWLERARLDEIAAELPGMTTDERVVKYGLDARRAETLPAGAVVLSELLHSLRATRLLACDAALREGVVERWLDERHRTGRRETNVRRTSVLELAEKSDYEKEHATHVARLALRVFDQTNELHHLKAQDRELLEYAALLHKVGLHVSFQKHHKHSYYMIRHAGLRGFTEDQIAVTANVARYYRKAPPSDDHANFAELTRAQRSSVSKLAAILRIADALDRGRRQAVRDVFIATDGLQMRFDIRPRSDVSIELEAAEKRAKYFSRLFGRDVVFTVGADRL